MTQTTLNELFPEWLDWYQATDPTTATINGDPAYDHSVGDCSVDALSGYESAAAHWIERLTTTPTTGATTADLIDRDLIIARMRRILNAASQPPWQTDPSFYLRRIGNPLRTMFTYALRPEDELVKSAISRLQQVPDLTRACAANLEPALTTPDNMRSGASLARAAAAFLTTELPKLITDPRSRQQITEATPPAVEALHILAEILEKGVEKARGSSILGPERYSDLLQQGEVLPYDVEELRDYGRELHTQAVQALIAVVGQDWQSHMRDLRRARYLLGEGTMARRYGRLVTRARRFVQRHQLVTLPDGELCEVLRTPALSSTPTAQYARPALLGHQEPVGQFWVPTSLPQTSLSANIDEIRLVLSNNPKAWQPYVAVHETYPGHQCHFAALATQPNTLRKVLRTEFFCEGWAEYAGQLMAEHGFFADPREHAAYLDEQVTRAARLLLDTGLHGGETTIEDAPGFLTRHTSLQEAQIPGLITRSLASPTQLASYSLGAMQIWALREDYLAAHPTAGLREFHDALLSTGALPLTLARTALLDPAA